MTYETRDGTFDNPITKATKIRKSKNKSEKYNPSRNKRVSTFVLS